MNQESCNALRPPSPANSAAEEMESWEALDVDDSDLPSLRRPGTLLPCKGSSQQRNPNSSSSHTLEPCSLPSSLSQSQPYRINDPPETLDSHTQQSLPHAEVEAANTSNSARNLIPGPAGAVQAAMHRLTRSERNFSCGEDRIPTQEYLMMAQKEGKYDVDFKSNPWLCAMDFLGFNGNGTDGGDDFVAGSPLSSTNACSRVERLPQVVAVVKSCTPNGLGNLIVTLKDPTGSIGASIHRKVITDCEFGKDIAVGAVLILEKVAVFSPSRSARYLNITLKNVIKVFCKNSKPPPKDKHLAPPTRHPASFTEEHMKMVEMQGKSISPIRRTNERIINGIRPDCSNKKTLDDDGLLERSDQPLGNSNNICSNYLQADFGEDLLVRQEAFRGITTEKDIRSSNINTMDDNSREPEESDQLGRLHGSSSINQCTAPTNLVEDPNIQENRTASGVKQRPHLLFKASLPQWTDEQLDELFAADLDDGGSQL